MLITHDTVSVCVCRCYGVVTGYLLLHVGVYVYVLSHWNPERCCFRPTHPLNGMSALMRVRGSDPEGEGRGLLEVAW